MLTEGPAIVQYIADQKPASKLAPPAGTMDRYRLQEWLNFVTSEMHKAYRPLFNPQTPDAYKEMSKTKIGGRLDFLSKSLQGKDYLMGSTFTRGRCLSLRHPRLVGPCRHRSRQMAGAPGLLGPRRGPARGQGGPRRRSQGEVARRECSAGPVPPSPAASIWSPQSVAFGPQVSGILAAAHKKRR